MARRSAKKSQSLKNGFVRIAVVGTGGMGRAHCRAIQKMMPHARLTAVCDNNIQSAEALLRYPGGGVGYMYCSTCETAPGRVIDVCGDKGKLMLRDGKLSFYQYHPSISEHIKKYAGMWGSLQVWEVPVALQLEQVAHSDYEDFSEKPQPLVSNLLVIQNTVEHILFGADLVTPGETGLYSLELANAVTLSSHEKQWVKIPISRRKYDALLQKLRRNAKGGKKVVREVRETDPRLG